MIENKSGVGPLPYKIRVSGYDVRFTMIDNMESEARGVYGLWSPLESLIRIYDNGDKWRLLDSVMHEVLHAIYWAFGLHDEDKEERIVNTLSSGLMQVYRDNPELVDWIHSIKQ